MSLHALTRADDYQEWVNAGAEGWSYDDLQVRLVAPFVR